MFVKLILRTIAKIYLKFLKNEIDEVISKRQLSSVSIIGDNVLLHGRGNIFYGENIKIGSHTRIGDNYFIMGKGGVEIGSNVQISRNVCIYSANHDINSLVSVPYDDKYNCKPVIIGNSVWIGMNVNIIPGITIGEGAVIGMGVTVSKNVGIGEILVGSSNRVVGFRNLENFEELDRRGNFFGFMYPNL